MSPKQNTEASTSLSKLTNRANKYGVREEQAVVDFGEFELVASEPVRHLRLTFIPN